jgi:hypothetical protein
MKRLIGLAGVVLWISLQSASAAVTVTDFKFFGVDLTPIGGGSTLVDIVVRLSYEVNQVDTDPDPIHGAYKGTFALTSGSDAAGPVDMTILVNNEIPDSFVAPANFGPGHSIAGAPFSAAELEISGDLFSSDALPPDAAFASAPGTQIFLRMGENDSSQSLTFDSFQIVAVPNSVPEPDTYAVLIAGLACVFAFRRVARHIQSNRL